MPPVEVLDHDRCLGHDPAIVVQKRDFRGRLQSLERRSGRRIAEVDQSWFERCAILVKSDEHLPAEGRKRVEMQRESHGAPVSFCLG
jgi:hypothetical protein